MTTTTMPTTMRPSGAPAGSMRIVDATAPLWVGFGPAGWGDTVRDVRNDRPLTAADVITAAGLGWRVEQYPVEAIIPPTPGIEAPCRVAVPRVVANVRSDTRTVLGIVGEGYTPLQNTDAFALADALIDSGEAHWLGAGSTRRGARVHALMRLDREITIGGASGEDVLPLLVIRNGHDGGLAVTVSVAPFRLACLNGMIVPIDGATRTWKTRHTARIEERLGDARRTLQIAWRYYDALEQIGAQLLSQPICAAGFDRFLRLLVPNPPDDADQEGRRQRNAEQIRSEIRGIYRWTPDLQNIQGTAWGALQAVTAYHDHHARTRRTPGRPVGEARFERATEPAALKDRALALLSEVER